MAVSTTNAYSGPYTGNGVTTVFPFDFTAPTTSEVGVLVDGEAGLSSQFTVSLAGLAGGSVTFYTAPAAGVEIIPFLDPSFTQDLKFENGSAWLAEPVNEGYDRSASRDQVLKRDVGRGFLVPIGEDGAVLPPASQRTGGKIWGFDRDTGAGTVLSGEDFKGDPGGNTESVGKFATVAGQAIGAGTTSIRVSDRDQSILQEVPIGTALPASGQGKWWTLSNGGQRKWVIASDLSTRALGAAIDEVTNDNPIIKELVEVAVPYLLRTGYISPGTHAIVRTTAADVIYVPHGGHIVWQPGAKLKGELNIGGAGYYLPFFAIVEKVGAFLEGAGDKQFIFTNRLTYGAGQDFLANDPSFPPNVVVDKRLGSTDDVYSSISASGIAIISSHDVRIIGLGCESVLGSAWIAGPAYCHSFISTSGNCNNLHYDYIDADDVVLGVAAQGGDYGYGGVVRTGRMSQDIGIPGHTRYDFRRINRFGATIDDGIETGADLTRTISHTVSYGGTGRVVFGPIVSLRRHGPLNVKNCLYGAIFESIYWRPTDLRAGMAADLLPEQGRIYFVSGSNNAMIQVHRCIINCRNSDVVGIGGDAGVGSEINALIMRDNSTASSYGFVSPTGDKQEWNLTLRQVSTTPVDPARSVMCAGILQDSLFHINLQGFAGNAPKVQVQNGSAYVTRCSFIIANRHDIASSVANPAFGDPASIWVDATDDGGRSRNRMMYEDGTSPWYKDVAAGTSYSVVFPFPAGSAFADITVQSDLWSTGAYFERMESFLVRAVKPHNRGGSFATVATSLGGVAGLNNTAYTITLSPAAGGGSCTVSGTVTGASPQASASRVYCTYKRLSSSI